MNRDLLKLCVGLGLIASCFASARAANPRYAVTQLHAISAAVGVYAEAKSINDAGVIVGVEARLPISGLPPVQSETRPIHWNSTAQPTHLALPPNAVGGMARTINNTGTVLGTYYLPSPPPHRTTVTWDVTGTPTTYLSPNAITPEAFSHTGDVVGINASGTLVLQQGEQVVPLILPEGQSGVYPVSVNTSGEVLASIYFSGGPPKSYLLTTDRVPQAVIPNTTNAHGIAVDMNEFGVAVGRSGTTLEASRFSATLFSSGHATTLAKLTNDENENSRAQAINDRGDIVGTSGIGNYSVANTVPMLWRDGQAIDLRQYINGFTLPAGFTPYDINNRGQIIGNAFFDHDNNPNTPRLNFAFRLDPIRSPGDTNYDNVVNFDDLLTLAQNYGKSGSVFWETGDFNFDWTVDFDDLLTLAQHYTGSVNVADVGSSDFAADWALARSLVPEPASLLLLCVPLFSRRSRK